MPVTLPALTRPFERFGSDSRKPVGINCGAALPRGKATLSITPPNFPHARCPPLWLNIGSRPARDPVMPHTEPHRLPATTLVRLIEEGELTAEAVVASCLARIIEREPVVRAWSYLAWPRAREWRPAT